MDRKTCEQSAKDSSDFKREKTLLAVDKPIAFPTPEKKTEPLRVKSKEEQTKLPEKYRTIADLFRHMSCSLRLLHLHKKPQTFQNICKQVEVLANRKFSYAHLARMKYILPEGILVDKVLVHDKKSLCMKPDIKITLVFDVVEDHPELSADMALLRYFCSRLIDFFNMHPEAADIPEAILPEHCSQRSCHLISEDFPVISSTELSSTSNRIDLSPEIALYPSFRRHFSQKIVADQTEKVQHLTSTKTCLAPHVSDCPDNQECGGQGQKECVALSDHLNTERGPPKESFSICYQPSVINTPVHIFGHAACQSKSESPNVDIVSSTDSIVTVTPAQSAPGRLLPVSDDKLQNMTYQKFTSCVKTAKRVLDFSAIEGIEGLDNRVDIMESSSAVHEFHGISQPSLGFSEDCNSFDSVPLPQEVEASLGYPIEKSNQSQGGLDLGNKTTSSLVDLVNVIGSIFRSVKRTPITKEELLQKIIMNSLDFDEIGEVEKQIEILEKLVPDWICKKLLSTGDFMYSIKEVSDLDSVRSSLFSNVTVGVE